eukprot:PITA_12394
MKYTVIEKEFLAVVHSLNKFRHYITGYQTFVHTDHAAIRYLLNKPDVNSHIIRWLILLQQFDLTIADKPGKENVVADFLSRLDFPTETKAIKAATKEKVGEFLRENIFYKFGYPRELVTNQGSQFTSNLIEDLLAHHKIKHRTSTSYHPQANGQVEVTNRALKEILTMVVSSGRKDWADHLVEATWAYNTTWKTTTGFTPYELVYEKKALLSIEFEYNTLRVAAQLDLDISYAQCEILL